MTEVAGTSLKQTNKRDKKEKEQIDVYQDKPKWERMTKRMRERNGEKRKMNQQMGDRSGWYEPKANQQERQERERTKLMYTFLQQGRTGEPT